MNKLDKNSFNLLSIELQINHFNVELAKGNTISKICDDINISYNTVRDRFTRNNYTFNKFSKQYENADLLFGISDDQMSKVLEKVVRKVFNAPSNKHSTLGVRKELVCNLEGKVINRSFRVYDSALEKLVSFCDKSSYNQYDILSQFILEGIEKYDSQ